jgi:Na+/H+ antiporter NhaD/arsenite permease-like protein
LPTGTPLPLLVSLGESLSLVWLLPFALMLASIAIVPLAAPHFWEKNGNKAILCTLLGAPVALLLFSEGEQGRHELLHTAKDYVSFLLLLGSLFVVSGGIHLRGTRRATPGRNVVLLAIGAVLASFIGTTGASMLLVRLLIRANAGRANLPVVVVFFIFVVSNIGGCLTPLGDPPLFLGYLKGVPFAWTFRLVEEWATACAIVLAIFWVIDSRAARREEPVSTERPEPLRIEGGLNFLFLSGILVAALASGRYAWPWGVQEGFMGLMSALSLAVTPKELRKKNAFEWGPIAEVAVLFAGIFVTMIPALLVLRTRAESLGVNAPWHFFWGSGVLSSVLDNAPTYLTFLSVAQGLPNAGGADPLTLHDGVISQTILAAISCGAVFMGANTYIGNGPNFMVKAVAESAGVRMPSFVGYLGWAVAVLIPTFVVLTLLYFR